MSPHFSRFVFLCGFALIAANPAAQDWPNWRGPNHNGSTDVSGLPAEFSKKKNVRWATALPGLGASTPIVLGERIFFSVGPSVASSSTQPGSSSLQSLWLKRTSSVFAPTSLRSQFAASAGLLKNKMDPAAIDATLNQLGKDRWELVNVFVRAGEMVDDIVAVLKRPARAEDDASELRGVCPACGYDLRGADHDACPECGWQALTDE